MKEDRPIEMLEVEDIEEVDEYLDEQYEDSTEFAAEFVDQHVLPLLQEFDYSNPDPDYVPGCATFGTFARLVGILVEQGFTVDELKSLIDDFSRPEVHGEILH